MGASNESQYFILPGFHPRIFNGIYYSRMSTTANDNQTFGMVDNHRHIIGNIIRDQLISVIHPETTAYIFIIANPGNIPGYKNSRMNFSELIGNNKFSSIRRYFLLLE